MDRKDNSRTVNIVLCTTGALLCIASGFICAPAGLLDNGSVSIISSLSMPMLTFLFVVPALLMVAAYVFVIIGKFDIPPLAAALCGAILFAAMDIKLVVECQMFSGVLINMIGVILVLTGVALQVLATETGPAKVSRRAAKKRNAADVPYERHHRPSYEDIYADTSSEFNMLNRNEEVIFTESSEINNADTKPEEAVTLDTEADDEAIMEKLLMVMSLSENEDGNREEEVSHDSDAELLKSIQALSLDDDINDAPPDVNETAGEDDIAEALLLMLKDDEQDTSAEDAVKASIAASLETPNQIMADFYGGIEEIFLSE